MRYDSDTTAIVMGGLGFIGSHFIEKALGQGWTIINIDKITYASILDVPFKNHKKYSHIRDDISTISYLPPCDIIINFAAESHVDNSILGSKHFIQSNVIGVFNILEVLRKYNEQYGHYPVFFQVSTDEVFGEIMESSFDEEARFNPSNPYSASKASAECILRAWSRTYGIPFFISRTTNNYGPRQHPEKLIPMAITKCLHNEKIIVHGTGEYVRNWIHVKDNIEAIWTVLQQGEINSLYNISSAEEISVKNIVTRILQYFNKSYDSVNIDSSQDRVGCDVRYALDSTKISALGWKCIRTFDTQLSDIVEYYRIPRQYQTWM